MSNMYVVSCLVKKRDERPIISGGTITTMTAIGLRVFKVKDAASEDEAKGSVLDQILNEGFMLGNINVIQVTGFVKNEVKANEKEVDKNSHP